MDLKFKLNILGKTINVVFANPLDKAPKPFHEKSAVGRTYQEKSTIFVDATQDIDQLRDTTLHEIIHVLDYNLKMELSENQVHRLACGLFQVLRENKDFTKWLSK